MPAFRQRIIQFVVFVIFLWFLSFLLPRPELQRPVHVPGSDQANLRFVPGLANKELVVVPPPVAVTPSTEVHISTDRVQEEWYDKVARLKGPLREKLALLDPNTSQTKLESLLNCKILKERNPLTGQTHLCAYSNTDKSDYFCYPLVLEPTGSEDETIYWGQELVPGTHPSNHDD